MPASKQMRKMGSAAIMRAEQYEKCLIGSLLENPALCSQIVPLTSGDFLSGYCRKTFTAITEIVCEGGTADLGSVIAELGDSVPAGYVGECMSTGIPEQFLQYKREVLRAANDRQYQGHLESLATLSEPQDRISKLRQMIELESGPDGSDDLQSLFHSREECETAQPLEFRINGFLQSYGINLVAALAGHGKTWFMLSMVRALLEGSPLFGHELFTVPEPSRRVLYLIPESSIGPFEKRLRDFHLEKFRGNTASDRLFVHTISKKCGVLTLDDSRLLRAAEGADVFLDTTVRLMAVSENDVEGVREFSNKLFNLVGVGASSVTGAHHSPKSFETQDRMTLENVVRGSGDLGANLCVCWGLRQIDHERNRIWVQNCKDRDFYACPPFILEGRPHISNEGTFKMISAPGTCGEMKDHLKRTGGRPQTEGKAEKVKKCVDLRLKGKTLGQIVKETGFPKTTVDRWLFEYDQNNGTDGAQL